VVDFQRNVFCVLGLPFDAISMADALCCLRQAAEERTRRVVSTPNVNWVVSCLSDVQFRDAAIHSDLSVVDGKPLVWIAWLLGIPISEPVSGSTLFALLRCDSGKQLSVFFFGGVDGAAETACRRLRMENRGLTCAGFDPAGFGSIEDMSGDDVIQRINTSNADFLVVALGAKKGQAWIERNRARLAVPLISHLGAVMNFVAGRVRRAPVWMQRVGLEWLWRIKEEPELWMRYLRDGLKLLAILGCRAVPYAWYLRTYEPDAQSVPLSAIETHDGDDAYVIRLSGVWTRKNLAPLRDCYAKASAAGKPVRLDLRAATYVDSAFVGLTVLLHGSQKQIGKAFEIVGTQRAVRRVINYCCAEYMFSGASGAPVATAATYERLAVR
jgi:N-acetylglucosaminyldiphosphoundecaprenol N-acetyl-beta-D-mannosaminyltransferase